MCCSTDSHHGMHRWGHQHACGCGCLGGEFGRPRIMTKAQRIDHLKQHLKDLQEEVAAVKEVLADIKKEK